ncbi:hypothetical protein BKA64DRAFT_645950 [Cadophora sp. MPI-SDFR-AT-0126]|nr:hypothetical protein BKA64DRAFT_645950 [Leotiomycetes sp. MPI-SDFR-AT-0126]
MHHTLPTMLAFQAPYTSTAYPYQPEEEYCDFCSTSPCSCGWAEDNETIPTQPQPDNGGAVGCMLSPFWPVPRGGPTRPRPVKRSVTPEDRDQPKPPPPKPLPPMLPPNPYPS